MASPLYADENIPTWKDRRPPFLWNSWRRTIKTHTVKNSEINETFASEKMRQEKDINRNLGTELMGKEVWNENVFQLLGFVAYVLQLSIKLRSHDDWIAKEHLPNSLTPRIVPGCLWHHHTVKLALMTFTWGTRPIHSAGHWIHTVDLQFLHLPMGPGTQGQMQLGAGCHTP